MTFKWISLIITLLALNDSNLMCQTYFDEVQKFCNDTDEGFADSAKSILPAEVRLHFHGLEYFPVNTKFRVKGTSKNLFDESR